MNFEVFRRRRARLLEALSAPASGAALGEALVVMPSWPVQMRNGDVEQEYRQDSDFFYLSGFAEPESVLVLSTRHRKATLFVRPRDAEREIWDGPRAGVDGAVQTFGFDEAFPIADFDKELARLLGDHSRLVYRLGRDAAMDRRVLSTLERLKSRSRTATTYPHVVVDPASLLGEMRLLKDEDEVARMRRAATISGEAHARAMAMARPGLFEYEVEAALMEAFRRGGAERQAYGAIVGSGVNATILHYRSNDRRLEDGDLVLIDAGCEFGHYASDITRTFPVNGTFSREQREVYEIVLEAQLASIEKTKPGATIDAIHQATVENLTKGLVRIGLLTGEVEKLVSEEAYKPFYMHRTSHWLGMDVHDVGAYFQGGEPRPLAAGMVLTVEPGLYIAKDANVPAAYRGIGVRIEDDILVGPDGPINLTESVPKTVADVERACRQKL